MKIDSIIIKLFGTKSTIYRVLDNSGEPLQVFETRAEAEAYVAQDGV
jgi:transposase-like protein